MKCITWAARSGIDGCVYYPIRRCVAFRRREMRRPHPHIKCRAWWRRYIWPGCSLSSRMCPIDPGDLGAVSEKARDSGRLRRGGWLLRGARRRTSWEHVPREVRRLQELRRMR